MRMNRRMAALAAVAIVGASAMPFLIAPLVHADLPHLAIVEQDFNLVPDEMLHLTVELPPSLDPADLANATVTVSSHTAIATRLEVDDVLAGELPRQIDRVVVTAEQVLRSTDGRWQVQVPTESTTRLRESLRFPQPGLYPLKVRVDVDGEAVTDVITFVHQLPDPDGDDPELETMRIAMVAGLHTEIAVHDDGSVVVDDHSITDVDRLAEALEASAVPIAVSVPPALLDAMASGTQATDVSEAVIARLDSALETHDLLASTSLPLDPSAVAAVGRADVYTEWLREGDDMLAGTVSAAPSRTAVLAASPLSRAGGALLRDLGARLLVFPRSLYDELPQTLGGYTDLTQLVQVDVGDGVTIDASVADHTVLSRLSPSGSVTATATAVIAVSNLLAARQEVIDRGDDPRRHGLTLAAPDLGVPSIDGLVEFTELLAVTPGLDATTIDQVAVRTSVQLVDGSPVVVQLPDSVTADLTDRVATVAQLTSSGVATASMLPSGDPRPGEWDRLTSILPSSAVTDQQVADIARSLDEQFIAVRSAVESPAGFGFTLTGRTGTIPVSLYNSADVALMVTVQITSPKLTFPDGPVTVELAPKAFTEVRIAIQARSNGRIPATLLVTTPQGDVAIGPVVPISARVFALSGLGNLVTGAALLVLLTWWGRHLRRTQRQRREDELASSVARHPVRGDDGMTTDSGTTTLPPS